MAQWQSVPVSVIGWEKVMAAALSYKMAFLSNPFFLSDHKSIYLRYRIIIPPNANLTMLLKEGGQWSRVKQFQTSVWMWRHSDWLHSVVLRLLYHFHRATWLITLVSCTDQSGPEFLRGELLSFTGTMVGTSSVSVCPLVLLSAWVRPFN